MEKMMRVAKTIEVEGKEYDVRKLTNADVFSCLSMLGKIGAEAFAELNVEEQDVKEAGFNLFMRLVGSESTEKELNKFLGSLIGVSGDAFREMPPYVMTEIMETVLEDEGMKRFLDSGKALAVLISNLRKKK